MKKPRAHVVDSLAIAFLKEFFADWVFNELPEDYSLDIIIQITENEEVTEQIFFIQSKGTDSIDISGDYVNYDIETRYLKFYEQIPLPILLVRYDTVGRIGYWINTQKYIENLDSNHLNWREQEYVRIKIPLENQLIDLNVIKNEVVNAFNQNIINLILESNWFVGKEAFLDDLDKMEHINKLEEKRLTAQKIHLGILNIKRDFRERGINYIKEVYDLKHKNVEHLQATYLLLVSQNILSHFMEPENLLDLCKEGLTLAQELNNDYYNLMFRFYRSLLKYVENLGLKLLLIGHQKISAQQGFQVTDVIKLLQDNVSTNVEITLTSIRDEIKSTMKEFLNKGFYKEWLVLLFAIFMVDNYKFSNLKHIIGENEVSNFIQGKLSFLDDLEIIIERLDDVEIKLPFYHQIGGHFEFINKNKALELYQKGLELSRATNNTFYVGHFEYLIRELKEDEEVPNFVELSESLKKVSLKDVIDPLKNPISFLLKKILGEGSDSIINAAFDDYDPTEILKFCKHLWVQFIRTPLCQMAGLHSIGQKNLICRRFNFSLTTTHALQDFEFFKLRYCNRCLKKEPRKDDWYATMEFLLDQEREFNNS